MTFYINENIFLDNVKQRMKLLYDKDDGHRGDVRMLMMLVYVPDSDIPVSVVWFIIQILNILYCSASMTWFLPSWRKSRAKQ